MSRIAVNGVQLAYDDAGSGQPVVFVHGGGLDRRMWRPQIEALRGEFRCIAYDMRGAGESAPSDRGYGPNIDQDDLQAIIEALGAAPAHLVGLSLGAAMAQWLAVERPDLVRTLTLSGGSATPQPPDPAFAANVARLRARIAEGAPPREVIAMNIASPLIQTSAGKPGWAEIEKIMSSQPEWRFASMGNEAPAPPRVVAADHVADLRMPVLVIEGEDDLPGIRARTGYLLQHVPNVRSVALPGAGHINNLNAPQAYTAALREFWRGASAS
jgi:pimeloyl-ACP methyl ester carboxylesterase